MHRSFFFLVIGALAATSCSDFKRKFGRLDKSHTEVRFAAPDRGPSALTLTGGLMIYVIGDSSTQTRRAIQFASESAAVNATALSLPNGQYDFYAVGFTGAGMTGTLKCSKTSVTLAGIATTVNLDLSVSSCDTAAFRPTSSYYDSSYGVKRLSFISCNSVVNDATLEAFNGAGDCASPASNRGKLSVARSLKVFLPTYQTTGALPTAAEASAAAGLGSACVQGGGTPAFSAAYASSGTDVTAVGAVGSTGILFGNTTGVIKYSTDSGVNFNTGGSIAPLTSADVFYSVGSRIFVGGGGGVKYSDDGGATWTTSVGIGGAYWNAVTSNSAGTLVFAGKSDGVVYKSTDSGANFTSMANAGVGLITTLFYDNATGTLYAGGTGGGDVKKSTDDAATWSGFHTTSATEVHSFAKTGSSIYIGTSSLVAVSTDGGTSFNEYATGGQVRDIKFDNGMVYLAGSDGGSRIYYNKIANGATGFAQITLGGNEVYRLAISNDKIYAAVYNNADSAMVSSNTGSGAAFPGTPSVVVPAGGTGSELPFAVQIKAYKDPDCTTEMGGTFFSKGLGAATAVLNSAVLRPDGNLKLYLRD